MTPTPDTPAARVLAALGAVPEGLTTDQIRSVVSFTVTTRDLVRALIDLVATGRVWVLPLGPKGGPFKALHFIPSEDALRRDRESSGARR